MVEEGKQLRQKLAIGFGRDLGQHVHRHEFLLGIGKKPAMHFVANDGFEEREPASIQRRSFRRRVC